jgi:hypothetical protein
MESFFELLANARSSNEAGRPGGERRMAQEGGEGKVGGEPKLLSEFPARVYVTGGICSLLFSSRVTPLVSMVFYYFHIYILYRNQGLTGCEFPAKTLAENWRFSRLNRAWLELPD